MAEVLVSAVVTVLVDKLYSHALMNFARSEGIDRQLEEWKRTLPLFQAVLADAGKKETTVEAVKVWLNDLQDLAYDIDDVLDDIATQVMKQDYIKRSSRSKLLTMLPTCANFTKLIYGQKISSKLDVITSRMKTLYGKKQVLGLVENTRIIDRSNRTTTSFVNVSKVLGREEDKQALIRKLLAGNEEACSSQNVINILSIVGMGGLGKTTLAQLLYNDQRVKDHFELMAWVCVSDEFDVFNISKQIYQAVGGENKEFANLDLLHAALRERLLNKRFLVVLDDVWNEDHKKWDLLRSAFDVDVGTHGSKFLVTTRKKEVASVMDSLQPYMLEVLSDEISMSLLAQSALGEQNFDDHPSLRSIAQGIVKKCDGLPLALIALGRVLKTRGIKEVEWKELVNNDIWNSDDKSDILPALKLSYYDLPSHLKQLFAYSSIFPKDYEFEKKKLVLLWMAQGFLSDPKGKNQSMESLGCKYFEELLSRSFFQPSENDKSRYIMHDLINDLATSVAGEFFFRLDENMDLNGSDEAYEKTRHFSFIGVAAEYKKLKILHRAKGLRTFLHVPFGWRRLSLDNVTSQLVPHLHFLRVLSLTRSSITEVPHSIRNLKHLRYLNFSETDIRQIPEEVSELYNLQSLLVRGCHELSSLPVSLVRLINLRHLDMTHTPSLKKLPLGIGGLTSLQTLSKVVIQEDNGFKISELKCLMDIQGELSIQGLEKVIDPTEAKDANLQQKKGLDDLELVWSNALDDLDMERRDIFHDSRDPHIEYEVLERLRAPHCNLKKLKIRGYGGMKFPSWLGNPSFDQLTELVLSKCNNCKELETLRHLTSLQKLEVLECSDLVSIKGEKEVVNVGSSIMGSLRQVRLGVCHSLESYCCPNSVEWLEIEDCSSMASLSFYKLQEDPPLSSSFSNLKFLSIKKCKNIKFIEEKGVVNVGSSIMGSLKKVTFRYCDSLESYCCPTSVERLEIWNCDSMTALTIFKLQEDLSSSFSSSNLKILDVRFCKNIKSIGEKEVVNAGSSIMGSLKQVTFRNCDSLESYCCPTNVESLEIRNCDSMTSLSFCKLQEELPSSSSSSSSSNLKNILEVKFCKNMKSIGEKDVVNVGSNISGSFRRVTLSDCHSLESYCCHNSVEYLVVHKCDAMTSLSLSKLSSSSSSFNLKILVVTFCKNIKSMSQEHLQSLTYLEMMDIYNCPSMEDSFPSCGGLWPPNLKYLRIGELKKPMSQWGLQNYPPSLVELSLYGKNSGVVSFGIMKEQDHDNTTSSTCFLLPPSLTKLFIYDFEEVESVSEVLQHLPHLQHLYIKSCSKLRDVPVTTSFLTVDVM